MSEALSLRVQRLTPEAIAPFGWVIGEKPEPGNPTLFSTATVKFQTAHDFDPGAGGVTEMVWATYGPGPMTCSGLESHRLTEQSFTPLGGSVPLIHVLAPPPEDPMAPNIAPDMTRAAAFLIDGTKGVCLRRGTWHNHVSLGGWANFLMLTRRSTTVEIERTMASGSDMNAMKETAFWSAPDGGIRLYLS